MTSQAEPLIVGMRHVRAAKVCASGTRAWCGRHGFDFRAFVKAGLPVETVEATGEAVAVRIARVAREEQASGR